MTELERLYERSVEREEEILRDLRLCIAEANGAEAFNALLVELEKQERRTHEISEGREVEIVQAGRADPITRRIVEIGDRVIRTYRDDPTAFEKLATWLWSSRG